MQTILVTGGDGYIGSHTCVELLEAGMGVVVVDNLDNGSVKAVEAVKEITGKEVAFYECDVADRNGLEETFGAHEIDAVIHFAGLKAVGESVEDPLRYYRVNLGSSLTLLETRTAHTVATFDFSTSATDDSPSAPAPLDDSAPTGPINPYGHTTDLTEQILRATGASDPRWRGGL